MTTTDTAVIVRDRTRKRKQNVCIGVSVACAATTITALLLGVVALPAIASAGGAIAVGSAVSLLAASGGAAVFFTCRGDDIEKGCRDRIFGPRTQRRMTKAERLSAKLGSEAEQARRDAERAERQARARAEFEADPLWSADLWWIGITPHWDSITGRYWPDTGGSGFKSMQEERLRSMRSSHEEERRAMKRVTHGYSRPNSRHYILAAALERLRYISSHTTPDHPIRILCSQHAMSIQQRCDTIVRALGDNLPSDSLEERRNRIVEEMFDEIEQISGMMDDLCNLCADDIIKAEGERGALGDELNAMLVAHTGLMREISAVANGRREAAAVGAMSIMQEAWERTQGALPVPEEQSVA